MKNCKIVSCGKKTAVMALAVSVGAMLMTGCSTSASASGSTASAGKPVVTVWAGGSDNVRVQFEKQIQQFNASQDQYTAELQFITSGTGAQGLFERVVAAKKAGQTDTDYDVIELGGDEVTKYVDEGGEDFFVPLDKSKIPNIDTLQVESTFRNDLVMPYRGTTVVLAYNSETVENPPETAEELYQWIKEHPGRFAYNTPSSGGAGGSFVTTSIYNFMDESALTSSDPANKEQWGQGFELLKELHPYMYKSSGKVVYPNKNQGTLDLLANKEVDMIPAWADMAITQMKQGTLPESIKITQIDPSFTGGAGDPVHRIRSGRSLCLPQLHADSRGPEHCPGFHGSDPGHRLWPSGSGADKDHRGSEDRGIPHRKPGKSGNRALRGMGQPDRNS